MRFIKDDLVLYAVTDRMWTYRKSLREQVIDAIEGGITFLQLREKDMEDKAFLDEAIEIGAICKEHGIPFVINDNVDVAIKSQADGVHVGQNDMIAKDVRTLIGKDKILGVSVQTVEQAINAQKCGANYLGVGAVFPTDSKADATDVDYDTLKAICAAVTIPVVAIGGIKKDNVHKLKGSGIDGVAVISGIFGQENIVEGTRLLKNAVCYCLEGVNSKSKDLMTALTIAGSDCSGGAGIQADIKTMTAHGVYAMSVITSLTAQNTMGVDEIYGITPEFVGAQMDSIFNDIVPNAIKIGMVSKKEIVETIADKLEEYKGRNIVVDPVMVSTSGSKLISDDAIVILCDRLFPMASLITPNISELEMLTGMKICSKDDMEKAASMLVTRYGCNVLCKGGHWAGNADDLLYTKNGETIWIYGTRIDNSNTHGTGCTLSSAIASNLAKGYDLYRAVIKAKEYISGAIKANLNLGSGRGPLNHMYRNGYDN